MKCSNTLSSDEDLVVSQLDMNLIKAEHDSESETNLSYSHSENELTARNKEEDPLIISFPVTKTESVVSYVQNKGY
jgi:prephenate dehydrogenase